MQSRSIEVIVVSNMSEAICEASDVAAYSLPETNVQIGSMVLNGFIRQRRNDHYYVTHGILMSFIWKLSQHAPGTITADTSYCLLTPYVLRHSSDCRYWLKRNTSYRLFQGNNDWDITYMQQMTKP